MARPGRPERNRAARSFGQLRRFHHVINSDKVFGTHRWLSEYNGPGAYSRKAWRGRSAEFVYNHIGCPPMLLWLAEVTGLPKAKLLAAKRAAHKPDGSAGRRRCGYICQATHD